MIIKVLRIIISFITVVTAIVFFIRSTIFVPTSDVYQTMILSLLILIATTFALDNIDNDRKWKNISKELSKIISSISPSQIQVFNNSGDWVDAMDAMIKSGVHTVDTASLDRETRSKSSVDRSKVWKHINACCHDSRINFRHIVRIRKNNFYNIVDRIDNGASEKNSYFGYYMLPSDFSFPTFGIIDNKYVSTRSPYHEGEIPRYLIIENQEIVTYFERYYRELWDSCEKISTVEEIELIYSQFKAQFSKKENNEITAKLERIKKKGMISDV